MAAHELVLNRVLNVPRDRVWRAWTEPRLLEQWFCPKPWRATDVVVNLRPGGEFSCVMKGPGGERVHNPGIWLEIVEGERLVFTDAFVSGWQPAGRPFMVAEIVMKEAVGGRTHYAARAMHWTRKARREHEAMGFHEGWGAAVDQLEALAGLL